MSNYVTGVISLLLIYDLQSEDWLNTHYMLKSILKVRKPPKMSNEMKCTNEKMTWHTQDTNLSWYMAKANVDHTISGQRTVISTLDHSATTPRDDMYTVQLLMSLSPWHLLPMANWTDIHRFRVHGYGHSKCWPCTIMYLALHVTKLYS